MGKWRGKKKGMHKQILCIQLNKQKQRKHEDKLKKTSALQQ